MTNCDNVEYYTVQLFEAIFRGTSKGGRAMDVIAHLSRRQLNAMVFTALQYSAIPRYTAV